MKLCPGRNQLKISHLTHKCCILISISKGRQDKKMFGEAIQLFLRVAITRHFQCMFPICSQLVLHSFCCSASAQLWLEFLNSDLKTLLVSSLQEPPYRGEFTIQDSWIRPSCMSCPEPFGTIEPSSISPVSIVDCCCSAHSSGLC